MLVFITDVKKNFVSRCKTVVHLAVPRVRKNQDFLFRSVSSKDLYLSKRPMY